MAKSVVEKFGGQIHCDSKLGEGSVFTISLPIKEMVS
jgi:signal transduction histidine kinase